MARRVSASKARRQFLLATAGIGFGAVLGAPTLLAQPAGSAKSKIGVIGAGHIGATIGGLWVKAGHPVFFSSRHPEELKDLVTQLGPLARAGSVADAIAFGDVVFIAVPYSAL